MKHHDDPVHVGQEMEADGILADHREDEENIRTADEHFLRRRRRDADIAEGVLGPRAPRWPSWGRDVAVALMALVIAGLGFDYYVTRKAARQGAEAFAFLVQAQAQARAQQAQKPAGQ